MKEIQFIIEVNKSASETDMEDLCELFTVMGRKYHFRHCRLPEHKQVYIEDRKRN